MIKRYLQFINESIKNPSNSDTYKYGCVLVDLDIPNWSEITSMIDEDDIFESKGIENNPHLTLLFGLTDEVNFDMIKSVFDNFDEKIDLEINGIGIFENPNYDVVKLDVNLTDYLQKIHHELKKLPNVDKHDSYIPHITIGFVKKGFGKKYIDHNYRFEVKNADKIKYSIPSQEKIFYL